MTSTAILIPARYNSSRFPGKPLAKLGTKTMIETVYEKCKQSGFDTFVLTDDMRIARLFNWEVCWIDQSNTFENGTERCAGAVSNDFFNAYEQFVNVQGDMPDVTVEMIEKTNWQLKNYSISTIYTNMPTEKQQDPNTVKMIRSGDRSLWFGRGITGYGEWHLGVYGYRKHALQLYPQLEVTQEETLEKLEQLRWLKAGWDIGCLKVDFDGIEINTPDELTQWNNYRKVVN